MLTLRLTLLCLFSTLPLGGSTYHQSVHYPPGYGYHVRYHQPSCTPTAPCYNYLIVLTLDGVFDFSNGNATHFREHYKQAGFDREAMMAEGRRAAEFLQARYGVDLSGVQDEEFLAPDRQISDGVRFTFVTVRPTLYMAARGSQVGFYNVPASAVWWNVEFSREFKSTGSYQGTLPAGSRVYYGSFVSDTCPHQQPAPYPTRSYPCMLSGRPNGLKFFRFYAPRYEADYEPGPFVMLNSVLLDAEWGEGRSRGVLIVDKETGVITGHDVLTFPDTCSSADTCRAGQSYWGGI